MARHNHGHNQGGGGGQGHGGGGRREFSPRDQRHTHRPARPPQRMPEPIEEEFMDDHNHDANETEIATYLTIRAQNIELLGLAAKIAGCAEPKQLLNDVEVESNMRRLEEIFVTLADWVDPEEGDDDIEE